MRPHLLLLMFCVSSFTIYGQSIEGTIRGSKNEALPHITVQLFGEDSLFVKGTSTDSLGHYFIAVREFGRYCLKISSIGYGEQKIPVEITGTTKLEPIRLLAQEYSLHETVVTASSFVRQDDKILIYPDKQQTRHSANGYDLLYRLMLPGVDVDRSKGTVLTFHGPVTLYVDGRKVDAREIRGLQPKEIDRIEYHDVPTGKYANDEAAINFVTKHYRTGGYVYLNGEQRIGYTEGTYGAVAKLSHGDFSYTLFAGHSMLRQNGAKSGAQETFSFPDRDVSRHIQTLEHRIQNSNPYIQMNISRLKEKNNLTGRLSFVRKGASRDDSHNLLDYDNGGMPVENFKQTRSKGWKLGAELYHYVTFGNKQSLETLFKGNSIRNAYSFAYEESQFFTSSDNTESLYDFYGRVTYALQLGHRISFTVQAFHLHTVSSVRYSGSVSSWQHFWEGESLLFAEYSQKLGKSLSLKLAPGLSYVQYRLHGCGKENIYSPRLRSSVVCRLGKNQQFLLSFPIGNGQLQIDQLNEVEQQMDSLQIRRGNSNQRIPSQHTLMVNYSGQFGRFHVGADVWYNVINHAPTESFSIEDDRLIRSCQTNGGHRMFLGQLSASWKATDALRFRMTGNWKAVRYKNTVERMHCFAGNVQMDYYWRNFSCSLFAQTKGKELNLNLVYLTTPANYGGSVSWRLSRWLLESGVTNPFNRHRQDEAWTDRGVYSSRMWTTGKPYHPSGYLKVSYTLDFGKKTKREKSDVDMQINSAILKAN